MINIEDILKGDFESYPEEIQEYMKLYIEKLRENIINELVKDKANALLKELKKGDEDFIIALYTLLEDGFKGYKNISSRALLNIYLENRNDEDFIKILEKVNSEM